MAKPRSVDALSGDELNDLVNRLFDNRDNSTAEAFRPWADAWACRQSGTQGKENANLQAGALSSASKVLQPATRLLHVNRRDSSGVDSCPGTPELPRKTGRLASSTSGSRQGSSRALRQADHLMEGGGGGDEPLFAEQRQAGDTARPRLGARLGSIYSTAAGFDGGALDCSLEQSD